MAGPDDDAAMILQKLRKRLGKDGFHFITPEADWETVEEDEDRQPGLRESGIESCDGASGR